MRREAILVSIGFAFLALAPTASALGYDEAEAARIAYDAYADAVVSCRGGSDSDPRTHAACAARDWLAIRAGSLGACENAVGDGGEGCTPTADAYDGAPCWERYSFHVLSTDEQEVCGDSSEIPDAR